MRKKWHKKGFRKNLIWMIAGTLVIVCIMAFPIVYFKREDVTRYNTRHYMEKITFALDTDVDNIKMVGELHRILNSPYQMSSANSEAISMTKNITGSDEQGIEIVTQEKDEGVLTLFYDKITNKVIQVKYTPKNFNQEKYIRKLCTKEGDEELEEEMKSYLKYLGLDVIEDWIYDSVWEAYRVDLYNTPYGKKKVDAYDYFSSNKENWELGWSLSSNSAKLLLRVVPERDGVKYYFEVNN